MLQRLASACFRHRWRTIGLWAAALVGLFIVSGSLAGKFADGGRLPGTDSQRAYDLLGAEMPGLSGDSATVVFHDPAGLDRPSTRAAMRSYLDQVRELPRVAAVSSPLDATSQIAADGTVAFATVELSPEGAGSTETTTAAMAEKAAALERGGVEVAFGGYLFQNVEVPASELVGLLAAAVILLIAFGSVVAMGLPIITALARGRRLDRRPRPVGRRRAHPRLHHTGGHDDRHRGRASTTRCSSSPATALHCVGAWILTPPRSRPWARLDGPSCSPAAR